MANERIVEININNNKNMIPDLYSALFIHVQKRCTKNNKYKIQSQYTIHYELINICIDINGKHACKTGSNIIILIQRNVNME